jgi:anaphase-promoting complex subunit 2
LRICLGFTHQHQELLTSLQKQLAQRLLIAGAHTKDVIQVYVKTIKAMKLADPRGVWLERVTDPIKEYLKKRKDTVRCIVLALTEDYELFDLQGKESQEEVSEIDFGHLSDFSDDDRSPEEWQPDPIDAHPLKPSRQRKAQDIIFMLIGIYGSKEMFIKEYKDMLADRILTSGSYQTDKEQAHLELLKRRFGDTSLTHCETMLQDVKDSKRIAANVHQRHKDQFNPPIRSVLTSLGGLLHQLRSPQKDSPEQNVDIDKVQALIVSRYFWPPALSQDDYPGFVLPESFEAVLKEYAAH